ncbi:capsid portal protein, partial [Burkholderia mallei]
MSKRRSRAPRTFAAAPNPSAGSAAPARAEVFTFDEPTPVMNRAEILDYVECWSNGEWFEPPVSFAGLAKSFRASTHH